MKLQGFVGPSYKLNSVSVDCQRSVNLYPEVVESGMGKEEQAMYLKSTPGLEEIIEVGTGPIRLIHRDPSGALLVVSGAEVYLIYKVFGVWSSELLSSITTSTGIVSAASSSETGPLTLFVDGDTNYLYDPVGTPPPLGPFVSFSGAGLPGVPDATKIVWIDGYFIFITAGSNRFDVSDWQSITVNPLSFASAEGNPDKIMTGIALNRNLILLNEFSTEIFSNSGNADFPFERIGGGFFEVGCVAKDSAAKINGAVIWLGRDESGDGVVLASRGGAPQRISTHALEEAIQSYADMSTATAYTYQSEGHSFYVLNFAEMTWVFDFSTNLWHERAYTGEADLERHRGEAYCFSAENHLHLVGDYQSGKVYALKDDVYDDAGNAITRMRTFPHLSAAGKRYLYNYLELIMETGIGLDSGQGSDPQVMLDWSDDHGHTWVGETWTSAGGKVGGIGDFKKRVQWRRLGKSRDRVFRIKITDPVPVTLISAEVDLKGGKG